MSSNLIPILYFDDGSQFPLIKSGQYTIGSENCDITINDPDVYRLHAYLISSVTKVMLKPAPNALVKLNGQMITSLVNVNQGDVITLGDSVQITLQMILKTMAPSAPIFKKTVKNPFEFSDDDDRVIIQPAPAAPPPAPVAPPAPVIPPQPQPQMEESSTGELDDDLEDFDDSILKPISAVTQPAATDEVTFTSYYPREFEVAKRGSVIVYAHTANSLAEIVRDVRKFADELGGEVPRPRSAKNPITIEKGTPITISLECDHLEFDPPTLTKRWDDEWVRFLFEFKAPNSLVGESIIFHVVVMIHGIEVARIANCSLEIVDAPAASASTISPPADTTQQNALAHAVMTYEETRLYQRIFISYSRQNTEVVHAYRRAQQAIGNEVFLDTESIRSGQDWQVALAKAIQEADVFQLFWSEDSAKSPNVRDEWDYALKYRCSDDGCRGFIRPVFWQKPMPAPPPAELSHLNFKYVSLEGKDDE